MADDLTYTSTNPAGLPNATKQVTDEHATRGHMPVVKIAYSADGDASLIGADANGLDVDVTRLPALPAGNNNIGDVDIASLPNEGQQSMANSISVAVASDQSAVPVSAASLPLPSGAATAALQSTLISHVDGVESVLTSIDGKIPASPATAGNQTTANASLASIESKLATPKTADFDTGAETDTVQLVGMALPKSGGAVAGGTASDPIRTDPTGATTQPVSAASLPLPAGAATSANQATEISALSSLLTELQAKTEPADQQHAIVDSSALPTGASTAANQATANTALVAIQTAVETIDNAIAGSEMQVDVVSLPALPAGTNNIGDVDVLSLPSLPVGDNAIGRFKITDGTDVADVLDLTNSNPVAVAIVDSNGDQITSFGSGGTQYTEDAAAAANPIGNALILVREDARAGSLTTTDGDNVVARGNNKGEQYVIDTDANAKLATITGHVDGIETTLSSILTELGQKTEPTDIQPVSHAALTELAAAIDTEVQCDIVGPLPAGTNAIGKLAANSGVDIGDVDITSVTPGTGATNLGKARGSAVGVTDVGVAMMGQMQIDVSETIVDDGDYAIPSITSWRELRTRDQRSRDIKDCNDFTEFTVLGNDTANLANSLNHVFGTGAVAFDKVNGAANTVFAGVQDTIAAINIQEIFEDGSFVALAAYIPSLTNVVNVFLRLGTDASNYNVWQWPVASLTAGRWLSLKSPTNQPTGFLGNGWNTNAITYVAFGVEFNSEANTLAGLIFDNVHFVGGRVTTADINASITSEVNSPNINVQKVGGSATDTNSGNASAGTLRVVLANNVGLPAGTNNIGDVDVLSVVPGSGATNLGKAIDTALGAIDVGVMALAVRDDATTTLTEADGDFSPLRVNSRGELHVNLATRLDSSQDSVAALGNVAHDAADSGSPVKVGFRADTTFQAAVVDGDRVDGLADVYGVQVVRTDHPNRWSYHEDSSSALTDTQVQAAPGAGLSLYITDICVSSGAATAFNFFLEEGSTKIFGPAYLEAVAGRGLVIQFKQPKKVTANTALTITTSAAIAHSIDIQGYIAP